MIGKLFATAFTVMVFTVTALADTARVDLNDGTSLAADIHQPKDAKAAVLFLHQCNRDQKMWAPIVEQLAEAGIGTMTVDFRGFGKSKTETYDAKSDYNKAISFFADDVQAVHRAWADATPDVIVRGVVGASCGGAAAAMLAGAYSDIKAMVLLSPSLREFWFPAENWESLHTRAGLPVLAIAAVGDRRATTSAERVMMKSSAGYTEYVRYNNSLHGHPLFEHDPNLPKKISIWLTQILK